jgi:hypothetical protein
MPDHIRFYSCSSFEDNDFDVEDAIGFRDRASRNDTACELQPQLTLPIYYEVASPMFEEDEALE